MYVKQGYVNEGSGRGLAPWEPPLLQGTTDNLGSLWFSARKSGYEGISGRKRGALELQKTAIKQSKTVETTVSRQLPNI